MFISKFGITRLLDIYGLKIAFSVGHEMCVLEMKQEDSGLYCYTFFWCNLLISVWLNDSFFIYLHYFFSVRKLLICTEDIFTCSQKTTTGWVRHFFYRTCIFHPRFLLQTLTLASQADITRAVVCTERGRENVVGGWRGGWVSDCSNSRGLLLISGTHSLCGSLTHTDLLYVWAAILLPGDLRPQCNYCHTPLSSFICTESALAALSLAELQNV